MTLYRSKLLKTLSFQVSEAEARQYSGNAFLHEMLTPDFFGALDPTKIGLFGFIRDHIKAKVKLKEYEAKAGDKHVYTLFEYTADGVETAYVVQGRIYRDGEEIYNQLQWTNHEGAKPLLLIHMASPSELRVYDSQSRITGLVNSEVREEIPDSIYDSETKTVVILSPTDSYRYEVVGTDDGAYGLLAISAEKGEITKFTFADVATSARSVHEYEIDWNAVREGEKGVTMKIDADGDGDFERVVHLSDIKDEEDGLPMWAWICISVDIGVAMDLGVWCIVGKKQRTAT